MAKNSQSENVSPQAAGESPLDSASVYKKSELEKKIDQPLDNQEKAHLKALKDAHAALLPGRCSALNNGLLGEFEMELMKAEKEGDQKRAADINNILAQLGSLVKFVNDLDNKKMGDLKVLCSRVGELFLL